MFVDKCNFYTKNEICFRHIDANKARYIETLREAVAIKSVSGWPDSRNEVFKMVDWTAAKLRALGAQVELAELGTQKLPDGRTLQLPKAVLGVLGNVSTHFIDNTISDCGRKKLYFIADSKLIRNFRVHLSFLRYTHFHKLKCVCGSVNVLSLFLLPQLFLIRPTII